MTPEEEERLAKILAELAKTCFGCKNNKLSQKDHESGCLPPRYYTLVEWYAELLLWN
jgi:hypothetical protein